MNTMRELTAEEHHIVAEILQRIEDEEAGKVQIQANGEFNEVENLVANALALAVVMYAHRKGDSALAQEAFAEMARRHTVRPDWFIEQLEKAKGLK